MDREKQRKGLAFRSKRLPALSAVAIVLPLITFLHLKNSDIAQTTNAIAVQEHNETTILATTLFIYIPCFSFLCGLIFSLIPHSNYSYKKKYLPVSLFLIIIMQLAALLLSYIDF